MQRCVHGGAFSCAACVCLVSKCFTGSKVLDQGLEGLEQSWDTVFSSLAYFSELQLSESICVCVYSLQHLCSLGLLSRAGMHRDVLTIVSQLSLSISSQTSQNSSVPFVRQLCLNLQRCLLSEPILWFERGRVSLWYPPWSGDGDLQVTLMRTCRCVPTVALF